MLKEFQNFINGKWVDAASGKTFENRNPARWDEVVGVFPKSGKEDVGFAPPAPPLNGGASSPPRSGEISCALSGISWWPARRTSRGR